MNEKYVRTKFIAMRKFKDNNVFSIKQRFSGIDNVNSSYTS